MLRYSGLVPSMGQTSKTLDDTVFINFLLQINDEIIDVVFFHQEPQKLVFSEAG